MVTVGLAAHLPTALFQGLTQAGIPASVATQGPTCLPRSIVCGFPRLQPMKTLLPAPVLQSLPAASQALLLGKSFFPNLIAGPFDFGLRIAFSISVVLSIIAALLPCCAASATFTDRKPSPS